MLRGFATYAQLYARLEIALHVPIDKRSVKQFEAAMAKRAYLVEYTGAIRASGTSLSGTEKNPLQSPADSAPIYAKVSPNGRFLVSVERSGYDSSKPQPKEVILVWDLATGKNRQLSDEPVSVILTPDGNAAVLGFTGSKLKQPSIVNVIDLPTGKELRTGGIPRTGAVLFGRSDLSRRNAGSGLHGGNEGCCRRSEVA